MNKKLLIFDFDGVIVDSIDVVKDAYNILHARYNLPELKSKFDVGSLFDRNLFESLSKFGLTSEKSKAFLNEIKRELLDQENRLQLFPEISSVLNTLSSRHMLTVISSNHSKVINTLLKRYNLRGSFKFILGGEEKSSKVEKIDYFIERLGVTREDVYYIGDTIGDITEAKQAKVKAIAVSWGYHNKEKLVKASPDYLFEHVKQLKDFFSV